MLAQNGAVFAGEFALALDPGAARAHVQKFARIAPGTAPGEMRGIGAVSEVQLKGPTKLCTQANKEFVLAVLASNELGAQLAPEHWYGNLTFLVSDGRLKIAIANRPTVATTATYAVSLDDDGDIEDDVMVRIWARVGRVQEGGAGSETVEIDSNVIEEFKYIPRTRIAKETELVKRRRNEVIVGMRWMIFVWIEFH